MIQLNPDNMVRIELTPQEQKTILTHGQNIDSDIRLKDNKTVGGIWFIKM